MRAVGRYNAEAHSLWQTAGGQLSLREAMFVSAVKDAVNVLRDRRVYWALLEPTTDTLNPFLQTHPTFKLS